MVQSVGGELRSIDSFDVDAKGRLKPFMLFSFMINIAWNHAGSVGFGYHDLEKQNLMWVISKFQLKVLRMPKWKENVQIETWGKRIERFYALRDFTIASQTGERLAAATGAWMILDKNSYRPQKLDQLMANFPWRPDKNELDTNLKRVEDAPQSSKRRGYHVVYSDLDINNHVNAANYLKWVIDSYDRDSLEKNDAEYVEMSFLAEAVIDDEIEVYCGRSGEDDVSAIKREQDSKELCRIGIRWNTE